ncbi:MAG: copper homeostasis protein CutC, partial [Planctomycetota bacterium]
GAARVELCGALAVGGLTPSHAALAGAVGPGLLPVVALVRPRAGDFLYSAEEFATLARDLVHARELGAAGIATGVLTAGGEIDAERLGRLVELARPLPLTFHRAFDQVRTPTAALARLLELGVARVLSSGGAATARAGSPVLRALVEQAGGRIEVIAAGTVRAEHVRALVQATGVRAVHLAASARRASAMEHRNPSPRLGPASEDYDFQETDPERVRAVVQALRERS